MPSRHRHPTATRSGAIWSRPKRAPASTRPWALPLSDSGSTTTVSQGPGGRVRGLVLLLGSCFVLWALGCGCGRWFCCWALALCCGLWGVGVGASTLPRGGSATVSVRLPLRERVTRLTRSFLLGGGPLGSYDDPRQALRLDGPRSRDPRVEAHTPFLQSAARFEKEHPIRETPGPDRSGTLVGMGDGGWRTQRLTLLVLPPL